MHTRPRPNPAPEIILHKDISCIIPTKDRRSLVEKAIRSVISQKTGLSIEIIMVDDGSRDNTPEIISALFPGVVIVKTSDAGPGRARNLGVCKSSSDILMFLDSDDEWLPDHAESLYEIMKNGYEIAYGITVNHNEVSGGSFLIPENGQGHGGDCFKNMARWCFTVPSSVGVTKKAFESVGGFPETDRGEDWEFFLRLSSEFNFGFCGKIISKRMLHGGSLCSSENLAPKIERLLANIKKVVEKSGRSDADLINFFDQAMNITRKEGASWKTFQDFFTATRNLEPRL